MAKKQIRISSSDIRGLIREALDAYGNKRYPEGVFSTDSEEGEGYKEYAEKYGRHKDGDSLMWDPLNRRLKDTGDDITHEKWSDNPNSTWDSDEKRDKVAYDKFKDEKDESDRYEKPFEFDDEIENQWDSEDLPVYNDEDDDNNIAGLKEHKQVRLSEEAFRNFVSYSVSRLLKEAMGKPIYDRHGEYDGRMSSRYGDDSVDIEFNPFDDNMMMNALEGVIEDGKYPGISLEMFDEGGQYYDIWPLEIRVEYTSEEGMRGDRYQPNDPDKYEVTGWNMISVPEEVQDQNVRNFLTDVIDSYLNEGYFNLEDCLGEKGMLGEENRGIMSHFKSGEGFKPEHVEDEDLTWNEYKMKKADEKNLGTKAHFSKRDIKTPRDSERDEHMFDDEYWAKKMDLSKDELDEIVKRAVKRISEEMKRGDEEEQAVDNFPKKATGSFTMNTRRGNTDKYKVYVEKTDDEELHTDIFIYDPMDKEWYPQAEYVVGIEEYTNGTWLPYWETFNGDVSIRALANCFGKVVKLWKKVGYLFNEDDEIPFRYAGDVKGFGGKIYESKVNEGVGDSRVAYWKIQTVLKYIENRMNDIEESYEEAEEDPGMSDEYVALNKAKEALEGLGEYLL